MYDRFLRAAAEINAIVTPAFYGVPLAPEAAGNDRVSLRGACPGGAS